MSGTARPYEAPARILLPTDFSDSSFAAFNIAGDMARRFDATLYLLHIIPTAPQFTGADFFPETAILQEKRREVEEKLAICKAMLGDAGVQAATLIETGDDDIESQIILAIEREEIGMVILSTHGLSGWRPAAFGSTAEKLLRLVKCPVLLLRTPETAPSK